MTEVIATCQPVCILPDGMKIFYTVCVFCLAFNSLSAQAVTEIVIKADRIEHPQGDAKQLVINLNLQKADVRLSLSSAVQQKAAKDWLQFNLNCQLPRNIHNNTLQCADGLLKSERLNVPFSIEFSRLYLANKPDIDATFKFKGASFSDEAGLHAAEKLHGSLAMALKQSADMWLWNAKLDWQSGEVFWQPFYIANGGHQLIASGKLENQQLTFDSAHLKVKDVGELNASGQLNLNDFKWLSLHASLPHLNLNTAYPMLFKPLLGKTAFADAEVAGVAGGKLEIENAEPKSFELQLTDVDIADKNKKFAFYKVNANIPWSYDSAQKVNFGYQSGELLNLPLGKTNIEGQVERYALTAPDIKLPILDGALNLSDISAARRGGQWYWHLSARLEPISMEDFSASLNLPRMSGKASAQIPLVTYAAGTLSTDGSLMLNVFNGSVTVTQLTMQTPLGITPKLNADIAMRNLDLGALTKTFSFGAIEGKLDGDIKNLELQNWKPVRFDAIVQSSPGKYPKKISQRAVENISALGGGGAAAAVQRSFLRFFEQFNYGKMGLSCRLRNDVCEMGGIESTQHGYVIVKGSGIPAITVMGYNESVGWSELLARIKRVTDGNSRAIVK